MDSGPHSKQPDYGRFGRGSFDSPCSHRLQKSELTMRALFRTTENSSAAVAGNDLPIMHTDFASIRRLKKQPDKKLPEPRPARQGER
jgi:hypothetical protein